MLNETVIDDGTVVTAEELRDIRIRAQSTRYGGIRSGSHGQVAWGADDNVEQALADRARLLRVLDSVGAGGTPEATARPAVRLEETRMAHGQTAVIGKFETEGEAIEAIRDYERVWSPVHYATSLAVEKKPGVGFLVTGTRATGE